jgi:hypothetical protein
MDSETVGTIVMVGGLSVDCSVHHSKGGQVTFVAQIFLTFIML